MTAAHHALTTATSLTPMSEIAWHVGYSNLGRFDAHYLDAFNRLPEDDLSTAARSQTDPRSAR